MEHLVLGSILIHPVSNLMVEINNSVAAGAPAAIYLRFFRLSKRKSVEIGYSGILVIVLQCWMLIFLRFETVW
jgi:hypothetical protein